MEVFSRKGEIAVIIFCDYIEGQPLSYCGFTVISVDNDSELAKFYTGSPVEDFEDAEYYSKSIAERVFASQTVDAFWEETGFKKAV